MLWFLNERMVFEDIGVEPNTGDLPQPSMRMRRVVDHLLPQQRTSDTPFIDARDQDRIDTLSSLDTSIVRMTLRMVRCTAVALLQDPLEVRAEVRCQGRRCSRY
jgi:hypothetical protein